MRGDPALFHRHGSKGGEADDIAYGINVFDLGLIILVNGDATAGVCLDACNRKIEIFNSTLASYGVKQGVSGDAFLAFKIGDDRTVGQFLHTFNFFAESQSDAAIDRKSTRLNSSHRCISY